MGALRNCLFVLLRVSSVVSKYKAILVPGILKLFYIDVRCVHAFVRSVVSKWPASSSKKVGVAGSCDVGDRAAGAAAGAAAAVPAADGGGVRGGRDGAVRVAVSAGERGAGGGESAGAADLRQRHGAVELHCARRGAGADDRGVSEQEPWAWRRRVRRRCALE